MGQMPEVLVLGVVGLTVDAERDVVGLGVVDFLVTGLEVPLTPRGDDGHVRSKCLDGQLETDLVVALAGAAVADGVCALGLGDFYEALGNERTGVGCAEQILLIFGAGLDAGDDEVLDILVGEVLNVELGSAGLESFLLETVELGALSHVSGDGDNFTVVVVLLQPRNDDGCVQSAGIGENYFFDFGFINCHDVFPPEFQLDNIIWDAMHRVNKKMHKNSNIFEYLEFLCIISTRACIFPGRFSPAMRRGSVL